MSFSLTTRGTRNNCKPYPIFRNIPASSCRTTPLTKSYTPWDDPGGQRPKLLDGQVVRTLDQGSHVTVSLPVTSGHLKTHENFITKRISHASPYEQTPAHESYDVFTGEFRYELRTPERVLDQVTWRLIQKEISRSVAQA